MDRFWALEWICQQKQVWQTHRVLKIIIMGVLRTVLFSRLFSTKKKNHWINFISSLVAVKIFPKLHFNTSDKGRCKKYFSTRWNQIKHKYIAQLPVHSVELKCFALNSKDLDLIAEVKVPIFILPNYKLFIWTFFSIMHCICKFQPGRRVAPIRSLEHVAGSCANA